MPFSLVLFTRLSLLMFVNASPKNTYESAFIIVVLPVPFLAPASSPPKSMFSPITSTRLLFEKLIA